MFTIPRPEDVPPGGYRYFQADTRLLITAASWGELVAAVKKHRSVNNIPVGLLIEQEIQEQLCSQLPPGWCIQSDHTKSQRRRKGNIGFTEFIAATKALAKFKLSGAEKVPISHANTRAGTCTSCFENSDVPGCSPCNSGAVRELVESIVGAVPTTHDSKLKSCGVCGCNLRAKVHIPIEFLDTESYDYPEWCWITKEKQ